MSPRLPTGQTLTMTCDASGKPEPEIKWYVNGTEITEANGVIELGNNGRYFKIANITLQDHGIYTCVAINSAGNDSIFYNVGVVQAPPFQTVEHNRRLRVNWLASNVLQKVIQLLLSAG